MDDDQRAKLLSKYNLTLEEYDDMFVLQGGGCAICGRDPGGGRALAVDHDHATRFVRGLLCSGCNQALGFFADDPNLMRRAIAYLGKTYAKVAVKPPPVREPRTSKTDERRSAIEAELKLIRPAVLKGMTERKIAAVVGFSLGRVHRRVVEVKRRLREQVEQVRPCVYDGKEVKRGVRSDALLHSTTPIKGVGGV